MSFVSFQGSIACLDAFSLGPPPADAGDPGLGLGAGSDQGLFAAATTCSRGWARLNSSLHGLWLVGREDLAGASCAHAALPELRP